jgi:hypothetical protein
MTSTIFLAFLAVVLAAAVSAVTYRAFAGVRVRRRATWELDRALWRQWIARR